MTDYDIDQDQIERDDADRAIDAQTDAAAEAEAIEIDRIVIDAVNSWQVLTVCGRGRYAIAELCRRICAEAGVSSDIGERIECQIIAGSEPDKRVLDGCKRNALAHASWKTPREIELTNKLEHTRLMLDEYIRLYHEARNTAIALGKVA